MCTPDWWYTFRAMPGIHSHPCRWAAVWWLPVVCLTVGRPCPVAAQDSPARQQARRLLTVGNDQFEKGQYHKALRSFSAAYRLFPSHKIDYNIAATLDALERPDQAADHYQRFLREAQKVGATAGVSAVRDLLARRQASLGRVNITCDADGAVVEVAGVQRGTTPMAAPIHLPPGAHLIALTRPGRAPLARTTLVTAGKEAVLDLCWDERGAKGAGANKGADTDDKGQTAAPSVAVSKRGAKATPFYTSWWFWTIVGVAAAGAGVGIGLAVTATDDRMPAGELGTIR